MTPAFMIARNTKHYTHYSTTIQYRTLTLLISKHKSLKQDLFEVTTFGLQGLPLANAKEGLAAEEPQNPGTSRP